VGGHTIAMKGVLHGAVTEDDAEGMRLVRNTCREWMTINQGEISSEQQKAWFAELDRSKTRPYVYIADGNTDAIVGYGLIRCMNERWWVSGGLLPNWRGQGYGKALFGALADLVNAQKQTCWLTVFQSNSAAVRTYAALGFEAALNVHWHDNGQIIITMSRTAR
jgi:ribosomal protein S18 acetylase RimI-like enzyme